MSPEELQKLIAQQYGNVLTAGQALTSKPKPIPTQKVVQPSAAIGQATNLAANAATTGPDFFGMGVGALQGAQSAIGNAMATSAQTTGAYDPQSYQAFMNPFQQEVIDRYTQEMQRQFDITGQRRKADAISAGAFGGGREGVLEAEAQRGFQQQLGTGIAGLLSSGFQTAQQQAQQAFENQRKAQQAQAGLTLAGGELGTGIGQLFGTFGVQAPTTQANLAAQLSQLGVTETAAQQQAAQQAFQNQMAQFRQPYDQLTFQAGLLGGAAPAFMSPATPGMGNPLLQGISALGGYAR
tara:strand:- start:2308 stop:3192 length:885 start_codon:yes stop_codon:yes gene_type:complete